MSKFRDMHGQEADIITVGFKDYRRIKNNSSQSVIYRVGSGECRFWVWAGVHFATKREAQLNFATQVTNLQAFIDNKIGLI